MWPFWCCVSAWFSIRGATLLLPEDLLEQPVALHDPPAHGLHAAVHGRVDLEDPAHLAALHARARRLVEVLDVELRGDPGVLVLGLDAEGEHPDPGDLP